MQDKYNYSFVSVGKVCDCDKFGKAMHLFHLRDSSSASLSCKLFSGCFKCAHKYFQEVICKKLYQNQD